MKDIKNKIYAMAKDDLEDIEAALKNNLNPQIDLVSKIAGHILFSGGKRLRPLLMLLSSKLCGYQGKKHIIFSTVFEYLHAATLLHDDLIDLSSTRRGQTAAHLIWGNPETILTGDFLLARSILIAAETNNIRLTKIVAQIAEQMSLGEISQLMHTGKTDISEKQYMDIIAWKTAVLFQCACKAGAIIADAPEKSIDALSEYGFNLGIAFQMTDDLLDYTSETKIIGKDIGADLKEGKITLPLIYALKHACSEDRSFMETMITTKTFTQDGFYALIELIKKYNGFSYTRRQAAGHVTAAKHALLSLNDSETKDLFLNIADYALLRDS